VLLISFMALPVRGVIAAWVMTNGEYIRFKYLTESEPACRALLSRDWSLAFSTAPAVSMSDKAP
jgi:hypothetical protein